MAHSHPKLSGRTLAHYRILELVGAGGMGAVYRARDERLGRHVALKVLPPDTAGDPGRLARFRREAQSVAALNHPNIITIHSVEEAEGLHFLTMELVAGRTLADLLPPDGYPVREFLNLALPVAEAVAAAHEAGILHRDLKPANVMLGERGLVKVLDFGLAKTHEDGADPEFAPTITQEGTVVGTVAYMSPEQLEGKPVDHRSDLFSLGVLFYEMLTGVRPFAGDSTATLTSAILRADPRPVSEVRRGVPPSLSRVIRRCLEKRPERRLDGARQIADAFRSLRQTLESSGTHRAAAGAPAKKGVVVLPFENLGDPEDAYFAQGITDEITGRLSKSEGLRVVSRKSAQQYKDTDKSPARIGKELGVDYIVEGTVRWARSGDASRIRLSPSLTRVADETQVWGEVYDATLDDIFTVQSDLASRIIENLGVVLGEAEREALATRPTGNVEAYNLYLQAWAQSQYYTEGPLRECIRLYEAALDLDPLFLDAHARLAMANAAVMHFGYDRTPERLQRSREACVQCDAIDPDAALTHLAWGSFHYHGHRNMRVAEYEYGLAGRDPEYALEAGELRAFVLRRQGRWEESEQLLREALETNPRDAVLLQNVASGLTALRRLDEADAAYAKSIELDPAVVFSLGWRVVVSHLRGDMVEARARLEQFPASGDGIYVNTAYWTHIYAGSYTEALECLELLDSESLATWPQILPRSFLRGWALHLAGDAEAAANELREACAWLETRIENDPRHIGYRSPLAVAYALLGRRHEAVREALHAVDLFPPHADAFFGSFVLLDLAWVYALVGETGRACDLLEELLARPGMISRPLVGIDPRWRTLHGSSRWRELTGNEA